ncbi:neurotactin [Aricia agestis]|uniref:neurotactin n=1 Tax=Aricia agestis TaxID=91739 RepID=UPI001C203B08|nr:neurotactin [Aricia agestis]XP_041973529.1 neurotactin [Aricia agestis]XP_041973530.1 neurotactin [Aricia agestis]
MSTKDINKIGEEDTKTPDKQQIEAEEKEVMLKNEKEKIEENMKNDEGPVKSALSGDITEQGREVKPKFIPIGAIKMPGFFTKNSDKDKSKDEEAIEKDNEKSADKADEEQPKQLFGVGFCPFMKFLNKEPSEGDNTKKPMGLFKLPYPKLFQKKSTNANEAALASMETLEDKVDAANDGLENIKLDMSDDEEGPVSVKLPLQERIRQMKLTKDDKIVCAILLLLLFIIILLSIILGTKTAIPAERPLRLGRYITTQTTCGLVEGILDDGTYKFYSIPFAAPPLDDRRFANAKPLNNMSMCWNGTLEVHEPGSLCLQSLENRNITGDENCLTLDIVTPHVRYDTPLPVVVLIGANTLAGGISPAQPSAAMSKSKEVVFVRPNFRLGSFGFLALDILSNSKYPPTSGNYALSDLMIALQWIQYNIKHFGGDQDSVTLLGHRAGATLAAALTTIKKAQKLYSRVWLSSPSVIFPGEPLEQSQKNYEQFKERSQCNDVECLRRISPAQVLDATQDTWLENDVDSLPSVRRTERSWLVLDGDFLRTHAYESWAELKEARNKGKEKVFKPMVFGTTQHSGHSKSLRQKHMNWTSEIVEKMVNESYLGERNLTNEVFKYFNKTYEGLVELISNIRTLCPLVSLARMRLNTPLYVALGSGAGGGPTGTGLADINSDIKAILGTLEASTPEQRSYVSSIQKMFYYYVSHGKLLPQVELYGLIEVSSEPRQAHGLPACDFLIQEDIVPRYAHID